MQRELDDLRRDRERENRRARSESRDLTAQKQSEIASKRLDAGSRFNLWFEECRLGVAGADAARSAADAVAVPRLRRRARPAARLDVATDSRAAAAAAAAGAARRPGRASASCVAACRWTRCTTCSASRPATRAGKQGELTTITEWYDDGDRVTEVVYVGNVIVRFSTASK